MPGGEDIYVTRTKPSSLPSRLNFHWSNFLLRRGCPVTEISNTSTNCLRTNVGVGPQSAHLGIIIITFAYIGPLSSPFLSLLLLTVFHHEHHH